MPSERQFVTVINTSNKPVDLRRDMEIGKVYICETSTSCSPDVNEAFIDPKLMDILSMRFGKALSTEQKSRLIAPPATIHDCFQLDPEDVGRTTLVEHEINTGDARPIAQRQGKMKFS